MHNQAILGALTTLLGEAVVHSIRGEAWLLWVQLLPAVMQLRQQSPEHMHLQAVRWTVEVTGYNGS